MSWMPESLELRSDSAKDSKTLDTAGPGPGWVNVVRAWPVPILGNTKTAFSLWVGRGDLETVRLAGTQWLVAPGPKHPLVSACADPRPPGLLGTGHRGSSAGTQEGTRAAAEPGPP